MFANVLVFALMAFVMVIVSSEVYAALKAVQYAKQQQNVSMVNRLRVAVARYEWSSVLLHEFYHESVGKQPAYRASAILFVWAGVMAAHVGAVLGLGLDVAPVVMMGSAFAAGVGFFAFAYGPAFLSRREDVTRQTQAGTWQLA